jgi:hypothetical protein
MSLGEMRGRSTRVFALVGVVFLGVVITLLFRARGSAAAASESSASPAPPAGQDHRAAVAGLPGEQPPVSAATAHEPARDVPALQARDQRRRDAMGPFQASLLGAIDSCLTPGPGPRAPHRLALRFERARDADAARERFTLTAIDPVDVRPGQPSPRETPAWACFAGLAGRTLDIPSGAGAQESSFQEVVAIPLPTSVGWAASRLRSP